MGRGIFVVRLVVAFLFLVGVGGGTLVAQGRGSYEMAASDGSVPFGVEIQIEDVYEGDRPYGGVWQEFDLYRSPSDSFSDAVFLDPIAIGFHQGATASVIDFDASPGTVYRYWLVSPATSQRPDPLPLLSDTGSWNDEEPPGPNVIEASNGTSDRVVEISWSPAPGRPVAYEISRDSDSFLERTVVATVSGSTFRFSDESGSVTKGTLPWEDDADWGSLYWVQAIYANGSRSGFGFPDRGYRSKSRVTGIEVERIENSRFVRISWNGKPYEDFEILYPPDAVEKFQVHRAPAESPRAMECLGTTRLSRTRTWNEFLDETAEPDRGYVYWVRFSYDRSNSPPGFPSHGSWSDPVHLPGAGIQAPEHVSASDSESRFIELTWAAVPEAARYEIYRSRSGTDSESMVLQESVSSARTSWKDFAATPGEWTYWIEAIAHSGERSSPSLHVNGERLPPPPPDRFSASDGDHPDFVRLVWEATADVDGFVVRSHAGSEYVDIPVATGVSNYTFDDRPPEAGKTYSFSIRSFQRIPQPGGPPLKVVGEALSDQGHRLRLPPLPGPEAVIAHNVSEPVGSIRIDWDPVPGAEGYQIAVGSQIVGEVSEGPFFWEGGYPGQRCTITVRAWRENGGAGEAGEGVSVVKAAPFEDFSIASINVTGGIHLNWKPVSGYGFDFEVFRSTTPLFGDAVSLGTTDGSNFRDLHASPTVPYWYWVVQRVRGEPVMTAGPWTMTRPISAPYDLSATQRSSFDQVELLWRYARGASSYRVYRSLEPDFQSASLVSAGNFLADNGLLTWRDASALPGVVYYYWVTAMDSNYGESAPEGPVVGIRTEAIPQTPANFTASEGVFRDRVRLQWEAAPGAIRYRILRGDSPDLDDAVPIVVIKDGTVSACDDEAVRPGRRYFYFLVAEGMGGRGPWSDGEMGFTAIVGDSLEVPAADSFDAVSGETIDLSNASVTSRFSGVLRDKENPERILGDAPNLVVRTVRGRTIVSGLFRIGYRQFRVRGQFDEEGEFSTTLIPFRGAGATTIALQLLRTDDGALVLTGAIDGEFSAILDACATPWHPRRNPWEETGRFTFLMPDEEGDLGACGIALAGINRAGVVRWLGFTPDGARFNAVSRIAETGRLPLFARYRLPQRRFGSLAGDLEFRELEGISDLDGTVDFRVRDESESEQSRPILGSRFEGKNLAGQVVVRFSGARDLESLEVTWDERNFVSVAKDGGRLNLRCQRRTGRISGFWLDGTANSRLQVKAVFFPAQDLVVGQYSAKGSVATHRFAIEPK